MLKMMPLVQAALQETKNSSKNQINNNVHYC